MSGKILYRYFFFASVLFSFLGTPRLTAQTTSFEIDNFYGLSATAFNARTRTFYTIREDTIRAYRPPDYAGQLFVIPMPYKDFSKAHYPICKDTSLYLVSRSGGMVYRMEGDSLRRLDNSFNHKMQINSSIFTRNDTIYRYGGYGFWSHRNFFTYFDTGTREWEVITAEGSETIPLGTQNSLITQDGKDIYVFSGEALDPTNPLQYTLFRKAWRYDTRARSWEFLGSLEHDYHKWFMVAHLGDRILYKSQKGLRLAILDPTANRITYYPHQASQKNILAYNPERGVMHSYYTDGSLYLLRTRKSEHNRRWDGSLYMEIVPFAGFLGDPVQEEPLYQKAEIPWKPIAGAGIGLLVLLGTVLLYRRYKERDKIVIGRRGIRYGRQSLDFDPRSRAVLELLVDSEGEVANQRLLDIVENPKLNQAHNIKVKNQLVDALNFRLKALLELEEAPIHSYRSQEDKRVKVYRIEKDHFILRKK